MFQGKQFDAVSLRPASVQGGKPKFNDRVRRIAQVDGIHVMIVTVGGTESDVRLCTAIEQRFEIRFQFLILITDRIILLKNICSFYYLPPGLQHSVSDSTTEFMWV